MKLKFLIATALAVLVSAVPAVSYAEYNDVTLGVSDTILSVGGVSLTVSATSAVLESLSVDANTFTVTMARNSFLRVTSTDRRTLSADATSITKTSSCTDSLATNTFDAGGGVSGSQTLTITVDSGTCTTGSSGGGGGGVSSGGGGGGSGYIYVPPTATPATPVVSTTVTTPTVTTTSTTQVTFGTVDRLLTKGTTNAQVKILQQILNSDPATRIAETGAGSPGRESDFFGPATQKALQKFQVKYGIAKSGDSGYGQVGPLTRTILNSFAGKTTTTVSTPVTQTIPSQATPAVNMSVSGSITKSLGKGMTSSEVKTLQQILNSDPATRIAETGAGSPGSEGDFFGPATQKAVQKFQVKYGLAKPGDSGYGNVGPLTRTILNSLAK